MARKRTGTLVLRKRNGVPTWHAQVWVGQGEDKRREFYSLETSDEIVAKRKLKKLARDLARGEHSQMAAMAAASPDTLEDYFAAWQKRYPVRSASDDKQRFDD